MAQFDVVIMGGLWYSTVREHRVSRLVTNWLLNKAMIIQKDTSHNDMMTEGKGAQAYSRTWNENNRPLENCLTL